MGAGNPPIHGGFPWIGLPTTTIDNLPPGDGQLSLIVIIAIAFAAFIAFFLIICLIVVIYNFCTYGTCCPPSDNNNSCCYSSPSYCCCCQCIPVRRREPVEIIKPIPGPVIRTIRTSPYSAGSYVSRAPRLTNRTYIAEPTGSIRNGTLSLSAGRLLSRRNSVIVVEEGGTLPSHRQQRRQSLPLQQQTVRRPQIIISADQLSSPSSYGRARNFGQSLIALPASSSASDVRCFARNNSVRSRNFDNSNINYDYNDNNNDDDDIRVIVRNQPYASSSSRRQSIIDMGGQQGFDNISMYRSDGGGGGGMSYGDGITVEYGGGGGGGLSDANCGCDTYGYGGGQQSTTFDISIDQQQQPVTSSYSFDDGAQHFQRSSIYPDLGQGNCY